MRATETLHLLKVERDTWRLVINLYHDRLDTETRLLERSDGTMMMDVSPVRFLFV